MANLLLKVGAIGLIVVLIGVLATPALAKKEALPPEHYKIPVDANAKEKDLLPAAPKSAQAPAAKIITDLAKVPEVQLHDPLVVPTDRDRGKWTKEQWDAWNKSRETAIVHSARLTTYINHLNKKRTDRFVELLMTHRGDLAGLPFVMGDACRMKAGERLAFRDAVNIVHNARSHPVPDVPDGGFWKSYETIRKSAKPTPATDQSCAAACMQMLATDKSATRIGLIKELAGMTKEAADKKVAATALTKLAVFSPEKDIRVAAITALKELETPADKSILMHGLRYPWPSVAENASTSIASLQMKDLIPELITMLDSPDPRVPIVQEKKGKQAPVVREVVRINHHRNCLLCHPPGNTSDVMTIEPFKGSSERKIADKYERVYCNITKRADDILVGSIPTPGEELPVFGGYREFTSPDILVRADITYLRQDFSLLQKVENAYPWPEMQRFDFLVRSRVLNEEQAKAYRAEFAKLQGENPYHVAAVDALRNLTGKDGGNSAAEWRAALGMK